MSILSVYHVSSPDLPNKVLTHAEDIASTLAEHGVVFEQWQASAPVTQSTGHEEMIAAYRAPIDRLMTGRGYSDIEVVSINSDHPQKAELRAELLEEHQRDEDVVRFFVSGRGLFNLHIGDFIYAVLCEKNDLILLPAGTRHWFDMGEHPRFVAIRLFNGAAGGAPTFTGDSIASQFPRLED
ncbi:1,2-dihydroxy-3-keto-5-methylthiopentene dioxygenase [Pseudomonas sp. NPDC090202]|uniref:1,2-dihydroxy-3-keto-5-methylthiopentene dioxygenase n=1 Tax=unclassified Pseudomonas TaxID=196821 RepID=UPI0038187B68